MSFSEHFSDINDLINEDKTGKRLTTTLYGEVDTDLPVSFWTFNDDIGFGVNRVSVVLENILWIESVNSDMDDVFFNTKCVGYALENGYDSVIVKGNDEYCIIIEFDDYSGELDGYLTEGPLSGIKIGPKGRKSALARRAARIAKKGSVRTPKKAPPKGIKVDILLSNTGRLSPERVERGMRQVRKQPPKITGVKKIQGKKYFRAEYNFISIGSKKRQMGYADISQDKEYCKELFCSCSDFFYRLYAPYVSAGLATWNLPSKFRTKQSSNVDRAPHNHIWTNITNKDGKLFLCKHLWAFVAYYIVGDQGNVELSDEEIDDVINDYFKGVKGEVDDVEDIEDDEALTDFQKAFGKLYVGQRGQDIKDVDDAKKVERGGRQTFYELPPRERIKQELSDSEDEDGEE